MTYLPLDPENQTRNNNFHFEIHSEWILFPIFYAFPNYSRHFSLPPLLIFFCATSEEIFTFFILLLVLLIDFPSFFFASNEKRAKKSRLRKGKLSSLIFFYLSRFDFTRFMCNFMPSNFIFTRVKCWAFIAVELSNINFPSLSSANLNLNQLALAAYSTIQ